MADNVEDSHCVGDALADQLLSEENAFVRRKCEMRDDKRDD